MATFQREDERAANITAHRIWGQDWKVTSSLKVRALLASSNWPFPAISSLKVCWLVSAPPLTRNYCRHALPIGSLDSTSLNFWERASNFCLGSQSSPNFIHHWLHPRADPRAGMWLGLGQPEPCNLPHQLLVLSWACWSQCNPRKYVHSSTTQKQRLSPIFHTGLKLERIQVPKLL